MDMDTTPEMNGRRNGSRPRLGLRGSDNSRNGCAARDGHALERDAIAAAKRGEWSGIHYLYARHADDVCAYVQSIVRDSHEAQDVTQDVFAKLITAIRRYEE